MWKICGASGSFFPVDYSDARQKKACADVAGMSYLMESRANASRLLHAYEQLMAGRFCARDFTLRPQCD